MGKPSSLPSDEVDPGKVCAVVSVRPLAALMRVHGIEQARSFSKDDFTGFDGLPVIVPVQKFRSEPPSTDGK